MSERFLVTLAGKSRRLRIHEPGGDVDVPQVRQIGQQRHHLFRFTLGDALSAKELFGGKANGDRAFVAHRILGVLDQLAQQAHAVLQRAAIVVGALVAACLQEMHGERQIMGCVHIDDVEAGTLCT